MLSERIETPKTLKKQRDTKHSRERDTYKTCNQKETRCTTKHETIDMRPFSFSIFLSLLPPGWLEDCVNRVSVGIHASVQRSRDERIRFRSCRRRRRRRCYRSCLRRWREATGVGSANAGASVVGGGVAVISCWRRREEEWMFQHNFFLSLTLSTRMDISSFFLVGKQRKCSLRRRE